MLKKVLLSIVLLLAASAFGVYNFGARMLAKGISSAGSSALGTRFEIGGLSLSPFAGRFGVSHVAIGNPEGFNTPDCLRVEDVAVSCNLRSFLGDVAIVHEIRIVEPEVTIEIGADGSNIGALIERIQERRGGGGGGPPPQTTPQDPGPPPESGEPGKQIQVDRLTIEGARVRIAQSALLQLEVVVTIPEIILENLGNASSGPGNTGRPTDVAGLIEQILAAIAAAAAEDGGLPLDVAALLQGESNEALRGVRHAIKGFERGLEKDLNELLGDDGDGKKDGKDKKSDKPDKKGDGKPNKPDKPDKPDGDSSKPDKLDVVLTDAGNEKVLVIKIVRELTGLGLKEAKELVDGAPKTVKKGVAKKEARKMKKQLEDAGATVELR